MNKSNNNVVSHKSAGGIVFHRKGGQLSVAALKKQTGEWVFPKGHIEQSEDEETAARREVREEIGISQILPSLGKLPKDEYQFQGVNGDAVITHHKTVVFFVFEANKLFKLRHQISEDFVEAKWLPFYSALSFINYPSDRVNLLRARELFVKSLRSSRKEPRSISICIPTHNGSHTIERTLRSIALQAHELQQWKTEIIVGLDHCTDNTEEVARKYALSSKIPVSFKQNSSVRGKAAIINMLARVAVGDSLLFIDDDITFQSKALNLLLTELLRNPESRIAFPENLVDESKRPSDYYHRTIWDIFSLKFRRDIYCAGDPFLIGRCMLIPRDYWLDLPEEPQLHEDIFLQFEHHPKIVKVQNAVIFFEPSMSLTQYFNRFFRISYAKSLNASYFSPDRQAELAVLQRDIDMKKVRDLPTRERLHYRLYRTFRVLANIAYKSIYRRRLQLSRSWFRIDNHEDHN